VKVLREKKLKIPFPYKRQFKSNIYEMGVYNATKKRGKIANFGRRGLKGAKFGQESVPVRAVGVGAGEGKYLPEVKERPKKR